MTWSAFEWMKILFSMTCVKMCKKNMARNMFGNFCHFLFYFKALMEHFLQEHSTKRISKKNIESKIKCFCFKKFKISWYRCHRPYNVFHNEGIANKWRHDSKGDIRARNWSALAKKTVKKHQHQKFVLSVDVI
jgi:hypothetical protein